MFSCIYNGYVEHRRLSPVEHRFRYSLYMLYLDLDELPSLLQGGFGLHNAFFSPASFCRKDHPIDPHAPLAGAVCGLVEKRTGLRPAGPVRLLTLLRNFGYYFSPLNLYFCLDGGGQEVRAIVAEVTNTPWLEKHWYVLWEGNRTGEQPKLHFRLPKDFHVSPFMGMEALYEWRLSEPGQRLGISIANLQEGRRYFEVTMALERQELSRGTMLRALARHSWMTARISHAIYWQALLLWRKKCPFHPHPTYQS
jgi:uncharacterized protein